MMEKRPMVNNGAGWRELSPEELQRETLRQGVGWHHGEQFERPPFRSWEDPQQQLFKGASPFYSPKKKLVKPRSRRRIRV